MEPAASPLRGLVSYSSYRSATSPSLFNLIVIIIIITIIKTIKCFPTYLISAAHILFVFRECFLQLCLTLIITTWQRHYARPPTTTTTTTTTDRNSTSNSSNNRYMPTVRNISSNTKGGQHYQKTFLDPTWWQHRLQM